MCLNFFLLFEAFSHRLLWQDYCQLHRIKMYWLEYRITSAFPRHLLLATLYALSYLFRCLCVLSLSIPNMHDLSALHDRIPGNALEGLHKYLWTLLFHMTLQVPTQRFHKVLLCWSLVWLLDRQTSLWSQMQRLMYLPVLYRIMASHQHDLWSNIISSVFHPTEQ